MLRQRQFNNESNHSLIYSIGEYRKSVTNLAIGCIRKQSLVLKDYKKDQQLYKRREITKVENKQNFSRQMRMKSTSHSNSIPTKKKRYNYGITLQSTQSQPCYNSNNYNRHYQQQQSIINSNLLYNRQDNSNIKSLSVLNKRQNHYLTQPFSIEEQKYQKPSSLCLKDIQNKRSYKNLSVIKYNSHGDNFNNSFIKSKQIKNYKASKIKEKIPSFETIILVKQNIQLQRPNQGEKSFFKPKQNTMKINIKQQTPSINYPKTQTYTSRSDYNIEKLTNKLDSYIKKHIKNG